MFYESSVARMEGLSLWMQKVHKRLQEQEAVESHEDNGRGFKSDSKSDSESSSIMSDKPDSWTTDPEISAAVAKDSVCRQ